MSRTTRLVALIACLAGLLGLPALATSATASGLASTAGDRTTVTVSLAAPDAAALRRLALRHHLSAHQREARLSRLVPSAATRSRVVSRLQARGFRVRSLTAWTVTASAPLRTVSALFGRHASAARAQAVLGAGVSGVSPVVSGLLRPLAATTGDTYRKAYAASSSVSVGNQVSTGQQASGVTIATLQFAQFDASDLTRYAAGLSLSDPVASGQYTGVLVDGGPTNASGAEEVALDQESILATAPSARQRAYFAPNTTVGMLDAVQQVTNDATAHHITALSISWGQCEELYDSADPNFRTALDNLLATLVAKGVTIFASSGDTGIYGCRTSAGVYASASVTYPASSPQVVAVGGTSLSSTTGTANNGSNWVETAWSSCATVATASSCARASSGGGASSSYARPAWQTGTGTGTGTKRLVPDIAAVGDANTGFTVSQCGTARTYGGTSLSAPVAAALLTDALSEAGSNMGVGDIHSALYAAGSSGSRASYLRDITTGSNGVAADKDAEAPSTSAGVGYDTVTGVGAVLWPAFVANYFGVARTSTAAAAPTTTANTVTWPLCSTVTSPGGTGTGTTGTGGTTPTPGSTTTAAAPIAHVSLSQARSRAHRARVFASWSTVRRSAIALAATRVQITDLTTGRVLYRGTGHSGTRSVRAVVGHRIQLVVIASDTTGAGTRVVRARTVRR